MKDGGPTMSIEQGPFQCQRCTNGTGTTLGYGMYSFGYGLPQPRLIR
jgi:hypothetical protein